jgi:hypothetical protein
MKFFFTILFIILTFIYSKKKASDNLTNKLSLEQIKDEIDHALRGDSEIKNINNFLTAEDEVNDDDDLIDRNQDDTEIEDDIEGHKNNFKLL